MAGRPLAVRRGMGRAQPRRRQSVGAVSVPQSRLTSLAAAIQAARSVSTGLSVQVDTGSTGGGGQGDPSFRYVNPAAGTNGNGLTWATAFNALPGTLTRGLTYWLADGSYGNRTFNTAENGTTLITIKKATIAQHGEDASGGWSDAMGDGQATWTKVTFTTSHWMWDGATGGGPGQWMTGFGFAVAQTNDHSVDIAPTSGARTNITCQHFSVIGTRNGPAGADAFGIHNIGSATLSNVTCRYFYFNNISRCPFFLAPGSSATNILIEYGCTGVFGDPTNAVHAEICSAWAGAGNITFRYNLFTYSWGTGGIMFDGNGMYVYGNMFHKLPSQSFGDMPHGLVGSWSGGGGETVQNYKVYNNTFVDINLNQPCIGSQGVSRGGNEVYNNLFVNCVDAGSNGVWGVCSHNHYINTPTTGTNATTSPSGTNPFLDKAGLDFNLTIATPAGFTLAAPYNVDPAGRTRGADGVWDRGAYERAA